MSAYGTISTPQNTAKLVPRTYALAKEGEALTVFPVRRSTVPQDLVEYLAGIFNDTVQDGRTYPQQDKLSLDEFVSLSLASAYFGSAHASSRLPRHAWPSTHTSLVSAQSISYRIARAHERRRPVRAAADCFVAIRDTPPPALGQDGLDRDAALSLNEVIAGRELKEAILGMYCELFLPPLTVICTSPEPLFVSQISRFASSLFSHARYLANSATRALILRIGWIPLAELPRQIVSCAQKPLELEPVGASRAAPQQFQKH